MADLHEIVERYKLQNARIQVGRERLWPQREGLTPSAAAISKVESALSGEQITGSVRISEAGEDLYWISAGKVKQPMSERLAEIAHPQERREVQLEAGIIEPRPDAAPQSIVPSTVPSTEASRDQLSFDLSPTTVDGVTEEQEQLSDLTSQPDASSSVTIEQTSVGENTPTEALVGADLYMSLHSDATQSFEQLKQTYQDGPELGRSNDSEVIQKAIAKGVTSEQIIHAIAQGPNVEAMFERGISLSDVNQYLVDIQRPYPELSQPSIEMPRSDAQHSIPAKETIVGPRASQEVIDSPDFLAQNLATFTERVQHSPLKEWGKRLQRLRREAAPVAHIAAQALGKAYRSATIAPPERLDQATNDLVRLFGKDGRYEGENFRYESNGNGTRISLKDGTTVYENGKFNFSVGPGKLLGLKTIPREVERVKQQITSKVATARNAQRSRTADLVP